jgi:hypothetical protein
VVDEIRNLFSSQALELVGSQMAASLGVPANPPHGTTAVDLLRQRAKP